MTARGGQVLALLALAVPPAGLAQTGVALRQAMLVAEDSRGRAPGGLGPLFKGLEARDAATVAAAVRGLGRLEQPALVDRIMPRLKDPRPAVRFEAATALGQAAQGIDSTARGAALEIATIGGALTDLIARESDPAIAGAAARSLGRLPYLDDPSAGASRKALLELLDRPGLPEGLALDAARGLEALVRLNGTRLPPEAATLDRFRRLALAGGPAEADGVGLRRIAWTALAGLAAATPELVARGLDDPDPQVRRLAVRTLGSAPARSGDRSLVARALQDRSPMVRYEALAVWGRRFQPEDCGPVIRAVRDRSDHVSLEAITLLGNGCPDSVDVTPTLWPYVDSLTGAPRLEIRALASWHRGARALVSLARVDPKRIRGVLNRASADNEWPVRAAAAEASAVMEDQLRLQISAEDRDDNVRVVAIRGLAAVMGHGADDDIARQLARPDYQLVMTAANLLEGSPRPERAVPALLAALRRITAEAKETSRDARMALLERLGQLAGPDQAPALERYLGDFDPVVAAKAATLLSLWTGRVRAASPQPLPEPPLPWDRIQRLRGKRLRVTMSPTAGGGVFEIALDPDLAPATVWRVAQRAQAGYYDGLTFHRVVPNFVIQGGSPNANEYAGDPRYLRDEIGPLAHERGTVGISTRGRDTGDAQFFVNLVDNPRLDFNYTVWGRVVVGLDVVDAILEGDVMDRVEVVDGR